MPPLFTLDDEGRLDWRAIGTSRPDLTTEQAQVIALAEAAGALRYIGEAIYEAVDAIRELRKRD